MSKYRFRLETLQKLRVAQRDQQRAALADGYRAEQILAERRAALADEAAELRDLQRAALTGTATWTSISSSRPSGTKWCSRPRASSSRNKPAAWPSKSSGAGWPSVEADRGVRVLEMLDERRRARTPPPATALGKQTTRRSRRRRGTDRD